MESMLIEVQEHLINNGIVDIPEETNFWMIRSQSGRFYDEFTNKGFIALGWNYITPELIEKYKLNNDVKEEVRENILKKYKNKQATHVINRCDEFINEVAIGDYVIIPSENSAELAFAKITSDIYLADDLELSEAEYDAQIEAGYQDVFEGLECPYIKRRDVEVLKRINKTNVSPGVYKAIASYQSLNNIKDYDLDILSSIYDIYTFKGFIYMNFNIKKESSIRAIDYSGFIHSATSIMDHFSSDGDNIFVKSNVSSPGLITLIQEIGTEALDLLNPMLVPLTIVYFFGFGGRVGSIEVNSLYDIWKNRNDKELEHLRAKAEINKTNTETELMKQELKEREHDLERERLDLNELEKEYEHLDYMLTTLIDTAEKLDIYYPDKKNQPHNDSETDD